MKFQNKIKITVKPNSPKSEIVSYDREKNLYKVNIKGKPENNRANIEVIRFFKKLTKREVKIIKGLKGREKILQIT